MDPEVGIYQLSALRQKPSPLATGGRKHQDWFDEHSNTITTLLDNMHKAERATLRQQWCTSRKKVQTALHALQNEWWMNKAQEIKMYADKKKSTNSAKAIYGPRNHSITPLKTADGLTLLIHQNQIR